MFRYFPGFQKFSYMTDESKPCYFCKENGVWLDGGGFYGYKEIDCICPGCLSKGLLKELNIETNEIDLDDLISAVGEKEAIGLKEEIIFRTPALPTWQDRIWPIWKNEVCVFQKIADQNDFESTKEFKLCFSDDEQRETDFDWLWGWLPEEKVTDCKNGNYDVTVYLFSYSDGKFCTWDAN